MARAGIREVAAIAWAMSAVELLSVPIAIHYFALLPAIFCVLTTITFAMAAISTRRVVA